MLKGKQIERRITAGLGIIAVLLVVTFGWEVNNFQPRGEFSQFLIEYSLLLISHLLILTLLASVYLGTRKLYKEKKEDERLIESIAGASPCILYLYDLEKQKNLYINRAVEEVLGISPERVQRMGLETFESVCHSDDLERVEAHHERLLHVQDSGVREIEFRVRHSNGSWRWLLCRDVVFDRTPEGRPRSILGTALDVTMRHDQELKLQQVNERLVEANGQLSNLVHLIRQQTRALEFQKTELAHANSMLHALATTDSLTSLKNHRAFQERLDAEYERASKHGQSLSVLLIDADHFKLFNDTYGHPAGDGALIEIARLLQDNVRGSDFVGRYGGEEFVIVMPQTPSCAALETAERIRQAVESHSWKEREMTVSVGVASFSIDTPNAQALVEQADRALYASKQRGRNCVTFFDDLSDTVLLSS